MSDVVGTRTAGVVRVGTYNVLTPTMFEWPRRKPVISSVLAEVDCDVIALQEVPAGAGRDEGVEELVGPDRHLAWHSHTADDDVGLVLASRWPLADVQEHSLNVTSRTADSPWSAIVVARVLAPDPMGPFWVAHHKPIYQFDHELERELQAVSAAAFVNSVVGPTERLVVIGDFDATPDSASVRFWTGRQSLHGVSVSHHDAWATVHPSDPGFTFSPDNELVARGAMSRAASRRIDYVMVRGDAMGPCLRPLRAERFGVTPRLGVQASDHYGLVTDLSI